MSQKSIRTAFETRLASLSPALPIAHDNEPFTPPSGPYISCSLLPATPETPGLDEATSIDRGIFQILLHYPRGGLAGAAETKAEAVQSHFPPGLVLSHGTITLRVRGKAAIAVGLEMPDRYVIPLSVRYVCIN